MVVDSLAMEGEKGKQMILFNLNHYTSVGDANKTKFSFRHKTW
jgi:hypothetical protein